MKEKGMQEIEVTMDATSLAVRASEIFVQLAGETLRTRKLFSVALSGGSTPREMYATLAGKQVAWERVHFFWVDERCVPPNHAESNYHMANDTLLSHIPIPKGNVHRIPGELPAEKAAQYYEEELRRFFSNRPPRFDLILLGLGGDGHIASLFPGTPEIQEKKRWVVVVKHHVPPPPLVDRISVTLPVLNSAAWVIFLVLGEEKAERVAQVFHDPFNPDLLPAQAVKPINGTVQWLMDKAAAANLP